MKLKVAVTDANIFIDLSDLDLTQAFFRLDMELHTTSNVLHELYPEQQHVLYGYQLLGQLTVHPLEERDYLIIHSSDYPKSLSEADKSVLHLANKLDACVLSSDKTLRNCAKNNGIPYHGMIWIFDQLLEAGILNKQEAAECIQQLMKINFMFRTNTQLMQEIDKRLKLWS